MLTQRSCEQDGGHLQAKRRILRMKPTLSAPWSAQPPEPLEINFCCLSHPICSILLWWPKQTKKSNLLTVRSSNINGVFKRSWPSWKEGFFFFLPPSPISFLLPRMLVMAGVPATHKALDKGNHVLRMREQKIKALSTLMTVKPLHQP